MAQSPPGGRVLADVRGAVNQTWPCVTELKWFPVLNILMRKPTDAYQNAANMPFLIHILFISYNLGDVRYK